MNFTILKTYDDMTDMPMYILIIFTAPILLEDLAKKERRKKR